MEVVLIFIGIWLLQLLVAFVLARLARTGKIIVTEHMWWRLIGLPLAFPGVLAFIVILALLQSDMMLLKTWPIILLCLLVMTTSGFLVWKFQDV